MHENAKATSFAKLNGGSVGVVIALLLQFASIVWFASDLSTRMDKVEAAQQALQQRYDREVIPRADLADRLDRIEGQLNAIIDRLMQSQVRSSPSGGLSGAQ